MPQLPLDGGHVAGLVDEVPAHRMPAEYGVFPSTPAIAQTSRQIWFTIQGYSRPA